MALSYVETPRHSPSGQSGRHPQFAEEAMPVHRLPSGPMSALRAVPAQGHRAPVSGGAMTAMTTLSGSRPRMMETREFQFYFAVSFLVFLPVVCVSRLLPRHLRTFLPHGAVGGSIFSAAKAAAYTVLPFVFMGG